MGEVGLTEEMTEEPNILRNSRSGSRNLGSTETRSLRRTVLLDAWAGVECEGKMSRPRDCKAASTSSRGSAVGSGSGLFFFRRVFFLFLDLAGVDFGGCACTDWSGCGCSSGSDSMSGCYMQSAGGILKQEKFARDPQRQKLRR